MIYTTRPQQVEAIRYTGDNYDEMYTLTDGSITRAGKLIPRFTLIGDEWNQAVDFDEGYSYATFECVAFSDEEFKEKFEEEQ